MPIVPDGAQTLAPYLGALRRRRHPLRLAGLSRPARPQAADRVLQRRATWASCCWASATLTPVGINGALYANVAHGLITGLLFFLVGAIKDRHHTADLDVLGGGLYERLPRLGGLLAFAAVASLGLPGLAGFWGEMLDAARRLRPRCRR